MRAAIPLVAMLAACTENEVSFHDVPPDIPADALISGQVCDPVAQIWLEGATVYTLLYDPDGNVYDTVTDVTNADGEWVLAVPSGFVYDVYVAYGNEILATYQVTVDAGEQVVSVPPEACFGDVDLSVAVVSGGWDDLAVLFSVIGIASYKEVDGQSGGELLDFLTQPIVMSEYQVIFFDGGHTEDGVIYPAGDPTVDVVRQNVRDYVQAGGVVFASDWAYDLVEQIWPDKIEFLNDDLVPDSAQKGEPGDVIARVADDFMAAGLGFSQVTIAYDKSVYPVPESADPSVRVYLRGDLPYRDGQNISTMVDAPLAMSFEDGSGRVYFTSYRNAANGAGDPLAVLQYLLGGL